MKTTTFILGALLIFSACKREDKLTQVTTKVHGHLMVLGTDEVINDRPYKIVLKSATDNQIYDEAYTDENGFYELIYENWEDPNEYLGLSRALMFDDKLPDETFTGGIAIFVDTTAENSATTSHRSPGSYKGSGAFSAGFQSWANLKLEKKAWLELHVENVDAKIGDRIRINFASYRGTGSWEHIFHDGQNFKVILPGVGNVENIIEYWVTKNDTSIPRQFAKAPLGKMYTTYFKLEY